MRKLAQTEIVGLVLVVILVTLGLFFSIALRNSGSKSDPLEVYSDEKLAGDFLIALLETHEPTCRTTVQELSLDCVRYQLLDTSQYAACTAGDPCAHVNLFITSIVDQTLEEWGEDYELRYIFRDDEEQVIFSIGNGGCTELSQRGAPGIQPLPVPRGIQGSPYYQLDLCRP